MTSEDGPPSESRDAHVTRFWDARAARYDRHYDERGPDGYSLRARLALTLRLVGEGDGTVLDIGMGAGRLCEELAGRGWTVSGIDTSGEMVALAAQRLPDARERLVEGSVERLPFADESFDAVAGTGVLEYTDVPRALAEVARVLRPGGRAVVSYPNPYALYPLWKTRVWYGSLRLYARLLRRSRAVVPKGGPQLPPTRFTQTLETAGLHVESVGYTGYLILPAPLDGLLPELTERLGRSLEGSDARIGRVLATQALYLGRKGEVPMDASATSTDQVEERADRRDEAS